MSDEIEKLKAALASKAAYANEMLSAWQTKDVENRRLGAERTAHMNRIEYLEKRLLNAEGLLADRERDHFTLLDSFRLIMRAYHDGADFVDEIEAILETKDLETVAPSLRERLAEYRTQVAQARQAAHDIHTTRRQEELLLRIFVGAKLPHELASELHRFLEGRLQNFSDGDSKMEAARILASGLPGKWDEHDE